MLQGCRPFFIPFPYAIDDHQTHNAQWLVDEEAAILIQQKDLTDAGLASLLKELISNKEKRQQMGAEG